MQLKQVSMYRSSFVAVIMMMALFCFMAPSSGVINPVHGLAVQAPRPSRQAIVNEMAAGLTSTGTSFNSFGNEAGYLNQENDFYGGGQSYLDSYGGSYEGQYDIGQRPAYESGGWKGFGRGKTSYSGIDRYNSRPGVKY